jgi:hypothetical protein
MSRDESSVMLNCLVDNVRVEISYWLMGRGQLLDHPNWGRGWGWGERSVRSPYGKNVASSQADTLVFHVYLSTTLVILPIEMAEVFLNGLIQGRLKESASWSNRFYMQLNTSRVASRKPGRIRWRVLNMSQVLEGNFVQLYTNRS